MPKPINFATPADRGIAFTVCNFQGPSAFGDSLLQSPVILIKYTPGKYCSIFRSIPWHRPCWPTPNDALAAKRPSRQAS